MIKTCKKILSLFQELLSKILNFACYYRPMYRKAFLHPTIKLLDFIT